MLNLHAVWDWAAIRQFMLDWFEAGDVSEVGTVTILGPGFSVSAPIPAQRMNEHVDFHA